MPYKIALIDDEPVQANRHKSELERLGFDVDFINTQRNYDSFRRRLDSAEWKTVDLFLVDVMMPPEADGQRYNVQRTQDGLTAGIFVAHDIRAKFKLTPIILWSTAPFAVVVAAGRSSAKAISSCAFIRKDKGVETVKEMFDCFAKTGKLESIWKRLAFDPADPETSTNLKRLIAIIKMVLK
jgi:CheY-like chemotaxis protein